MIQATLLGARFREGTDRQGNSRIYYSVDLYTEAGPGSASIDADQYAKLKDTPMGTPLKLLLRPSIYQGRLDFRVADLQVIAQQARAA